MVSSRGSAAEDAESDAKPAPEGLVGRVMSGRYRVEKLLGEGGMGGVYLAEHTLMRKLVALKVLHPEMTSVPEIVARFEREAVAAANIDHPHVAAATDFGTTEDGAFYLVLEYVDGRSLRHELERGKMTPQRALHIVRQISLALVRAHELGFVHRDLKPDNVMLVERGGDPDFVKVLDFGIAKVPLEQLGKAREGSAPGNSGTRAPLTRVGAVFGTPEYMAPEQALGQEVDARADLYALGVMFYETLAGAPPFVAETITALLTKQLTEAPVPLSSRLPPGALPPGIEELVHALLQKEASQRPASAQVVVDTIDAIVANAGFVTIGERRSMVGSGPLSPGSLAVANTAMGVSAVSTGGFQSRDAIAQTNYAGMTAPSAPRKLDPKAIGRELMRTLRTLPPTTRIAVVGGVATLAGLLLTILVLAARPSRSRGGAAAANSGAPTPTLPWSTPKATGDELSRAKTAGRGALEQLAFQYPDDPKVVRALIDAARLEKQYGVVVKQTEKLLRLDKSAKEDEGVIEALVAAAHGSPEAADPAIALLESNFDERGVDALYDIATGKANPQLRAKAAKSLEKSDVRDEASKATLFLLDFRATKACEGKRELLSRARDDGDARAYAVVKTLAEGKGCGFLNLSDCYPCMRTKDAAKELKETLAKLEDRKK
jgi:hypothetical protein